MSLSDQVTNWLYNVLQPQYVNKQVAYTHIHQFLEVHLKRNLHFKIRTRVFTSGDGHSDLLINLYGSIPVQQTSVPVEIWVPLHYPFSSNAHGSGVPSVFVSPKHEENLFLKPGNHVDTQGRVYHPYLAAWHNECTPNNPEASKFNLLALMNVVYDIIVKEVPVQSVPTEVSSASDALDVQTQFQLRQEVNSPGPQLPPKPSKGPISMQHTASSDANAPRKPSKVPIIGPASGIPTPEPISSPIPLKYRAPLPLPEQQGPPSQDPANSPRRQNLSPEHHHRTPPSPGQNGATSIQQRVPYPNAPYQAAPQAYQSPISPPSVRRAPRNSHLVKTKGPVQSMDLMDSAETNVRSDVQEKLDGHVREALTATAINFLGDSSSDSAFAISSPVKLQEAKINALRSQLTHHHQQAVANSKNLDDHIAYLRTQLQAVTRLNQELGALDEVNASQADRVSTKDATVELDDLIIADSTLVKQLYDVVSEIKAIKDTIGLVSGTFHTQSELINDSRVDLCVKTVRNLGRELFWLELTKNEIASIMGLDQS